MGSIETYFSCEIERTETLIIVALFGVAVVIFTIFRKSKRKKEEYNQLLLYAEKLLSELEDAEENVRVAYLQGRADENIFLTRHMITNQEIISRSPISTEDSALIQKSKTAIEQHTEQIEKEDEEREFVNKYKHESLFAAMNAFCHVYNHYWVYPRLRFHIQNVSVRFSPSRQVVFFRMLFACVKINLKHQVSPEITFEQAGSDIILNYIAPDAITHSGAYLDAFKIVKHIVTPERIIFNQQGITIRFPLDNAAR